MKKVSLLVLLVFSFIASFSQTYPVTQILGSPQTLVLSKGGLRADSSLILPSFPDTASANLSTYIKNYPGNMIIVGNQTFVRNANATQWLALATSGTAVGSVTSITQGYGITNTPNPITVTGTVKVDTTAATGLSGKYVRFTDTSVMLSKYLRRSDTTAMLLPYLRKADTTAMLSKYVRKTTTISTSDPLYVNNAASASLSGNISLLITKASTLGSGYLDNTDWNTFNNKLNKSDTAAMLSKYLRRSDTTAMLLPYLRKADTTAMLSKYLRISDTTAMLSPYLRKVDTTNKFVNTITRTPGKDSIIYFIGGTRYAIKDSSGGGVTSVTATYPALSSGGATPNISMYQASNTVDGFLSTTDWIKFNNKVDSVSVSGGILTKTGTANPIISSSVNSSKLVGRGTSSSGTMQEITIGSGLSMSGTTLSAIGGGGGGSQTLQQTLTVGDTLTTYFYFKTNLANDSTVNLNGARLTAPRIYDFPDSSGILALKSDLIPFHYQIDLSASSYTMTKYGVYEIKIATDSTTPYYIIFPNATLFTGQRITLINADASGYNNNAIIDTTGEANTRPKYQGTYKTIGQIPYGMTYEFISTNGVWMSTSPTPVYVDTFASDYDGTGITTYNIPFNGTYKLVNVNGSKQNDYYIVTFPDPKKNNGERITLINADSIYSLKIEGTWLPVSKNSFGGLVVKVAPQSTYEFVSIDSQWVCVSRSSHPTVFNIDLSVGDYKIPSNGIFQINDASTNNIIFPEAVEFDGTTIIVINSDNTNDATIGGTQPEDASGTAVANIGLMNSYTFVSIGGKWFLINVY